MSTETPPVSIEALLAHADWARRLARHLVRDATEAEDVVQETWAAALRSPPDGARPPRPWLAEVIRNFVRIRKRRAARWQARRDDPSVPAPAGAPSPEVVVGGLEAHRLVAEAMAALDEPFRTTLWLRYYQGKEPSDIARELDIPAGTVRWRVKEGLERVRRQLDARAGGRTRWMPAIALLAEMRAPVAGGALAMAAKTKLLVAAGLFVVAAGVGVRVGRVEPGGGATAGPPTPAAPIALVAARADAAASEGEGDRPPRPFVRGGENTRPPPRFVAAPETAAAATAKMTGSLDPQVIRDVMRSRVKQIKKCYEALLTRDPRAGGRISIQFTVQDRDGKGRVSRATIAPQDDGVPELESPATQLCILNALADAEFPAPEGGDVEVTYPFKFTPSGGATDGGAS